jgi:Fur family transcriptional regulator, zinc uptake regulator
MIASHHNHAKCTAALIARAEQTCATTGARLTEQRREVLACVAQSHAAVGAYDVIERMAAHGPKPAPITVYRALDFLLAHKLVHKIESRSAFVACACAHTDGVPALLICDTCGNVDEIIEPNTDKNLHQVAEAQGFKMNRAVIELSGTCRQCANV